MDDGQVPLTASFDLALYLVARLASRELMADCARTLLLDPGRVSQAPYASLATSTSHGDEAVARAETWLEAHHAEAVSLAELAGAVALSERTLARRFKRATGRTVGGYLQALRVERAKRLLERGSEPVEAVAAAVGYGDVPAFFKRFKALTGLTPGGYRERFGIVTIR